MTKPVRLKLHIREREDFRRFYDSNLPSTALFVPTSDPPAAGERVTVDLLFHGGPHVILQGQIVWRRATGDARTRAGVGVGLDAAERPKLQYVLGYVRGGMLDVRGRRRLLIKLRVAYTGPRGRRVNFTRDLNEEGAFIRTSEALDAGSRTEIIISPPTPEYRAISVHAVVIRRQPDDPERGVGLRFEFVDAAEKDRYLVFFRKLESDYIDGKLPSEVLS